MKKLVLLLSALILNSCEGFFGVSDYAGCTNSIDNAKKSNLLKDIYAPSKKDILINNEEYEIVEAWTAYRFKTKKSNEITQNFYDFLVILKNTKTKEIGLSSEITSHYSDFIKFSSIDNSKYGIGIETNKMCVVYNSSKILNEIRISFISDNKKNIVVFKKQ